MTCIEKLNNLIQPKKDSDYTTYQKQSGQPNTEIVQSLDFTKVW